MVSRGRISDIQLLRFEIPENQVGGKAPIVKIILCYPHMTIQFQVLLKIHGDEYLRLPYGSFQPTQADRW